MSTLVQINTQAARLDPESEFSDPMAIVEEPGLTRGQKLAALQRWCEAVQSRLSSASEGMQTPTEANATDAALIERIGEAQKKLEHPQVTD